MEMCEHTIILKGKYIILKAYLTSHPSLSLFCFFTNTEVQDLKNFQ